MAATALQSVPLPTPDVPGLAVDDETVADVYRYAVARGEITDHDELAVELGLAVATVDAVVERLLHQRLLTPAPGADRLLPVEPAVAAAIQVSPLEREIVERRDRITEVRRRATALQAEFDSARQVVGDAGRIDRLVSPDVVRGHLEVLVEHCERTALVVQAGHDDLDVVLRLCDRLVERGIAVRVVCPHRSRADLGTRARLKALAESGAAIRTLAQVPHGAVVVDGRSALLLAEDGTAVVLKDDSTVLDFTVLAMEQLWDAAVAADLLDVGYAAAGDDLRRRLLGLMAQGLTDDVVARKLGLSVRTCRRHIATLMRDLGAHSRFQAGVLAGRAIAEG